MSLKRSKNGRKPPKVLETEHIVAFDVDETLIKWHKDHKVPGTGKIKIVDPYSKEVLYLRPHSVHKRLLKQYKERGFGILVWSHAGSKWASVIVETLGLSEYVDLIMAKPARHVDDKTEKSDIIGLHVFLEDKE
jgi:phosphoglycolate phosphatase-like HAD superfamily hydrolase